MVHCKKIHEIWTEKIKVVTACEICNALEAFVGRKSPGEEYFSAALFCHLPSLPLLDLLSFPSFIIEPHEITFRKATFQKNVSKQVSHTGSKVQYMSENPDFDSSLLKNQIEN